jgi:glycosyltransferase involved in cell wall biosynthesis
MTSELTTTVKMDNKFTDEMLDLIKIINCQKYKAIILYLIPENHPPKQDLIQLLSEMAIRDYLCFVCKPSYSGGIETLGMNLFLVNQGFIMIPVMKSLSAIVLTTQNIHPDWSEILHHKFLWFHADGNNNNDMSKIYDQADLISYYFSTLSLNEESSFDSRELCFRADGENHVNANLLEQKIRSLPKGWHSFANLDLVGKVAVMAATFLDFSGEYFYNGGAERYLIDLAEICRELNSELVIFQYGDYPWMRRFKNIDIVSLSRHGVKPEGWLLKCAKDFNHIFYQLVQGRTVLNVYSAFFEAWPLAASPDIGISHGVSWDNPYNDYKSAAEYWVMNQRYIEGAKACEELVSVDTNSANWFQTVNFELGQRTKLIPNYVDLSVFKPREEYLAKRDKIVILYPRQLYSARGLYLVLEIMEEILDRYPAVEFHFVGRGGGEDINLIIDKQRKWNKRVKYYPLTMEEMPQAYIAADISLIPSIHSEGTSLSCLEAMASGNAVIATRIGGLSDLIVNNYNGLLIDPKPENLKQAIISLLEDQEQLNLFKKRNHEVAKAFSQNIWRNRWISLLKDKMDIPADKINKSRVIEIRLSTNPVDYSKLGELITTLLINGDLVYVRSSEIPDPELSFSRIQWLSPEAPLFTACDLILKW